MMDRRELLKSSLLGCGAAAASGAVGSLFTRAVFAGDKASAGPIVETSLGKLRGAFGNGVYCFKGIHYGASTEGPRRFLPPSPLTPWTGVRDALEIGPPAPQDRDLMSVFPELRDFLGDMVGPGTMGEDCLVLNLWTPSLHGPSKRPVMVWLHGGGFAIGSSGIPVYEGTNLAAKHEVVVVGVNHRLNVFGHLYLGGIGGEKYADSGNVGMLDIVLALQWVRANIGRFGGNPDNVTIFGESGGGAKVSMLMAMPSAKGLFHKAIVESGSALRGSSREEADATARKFLEQIHVAPDRVDDLRKVPMDQLIAALHSMGESSQSLRPVVDGRSLPRRPFDPDAPAVTANVPMLIGTNGDESRLVIGLRDSGQFSLNEADMRTRLKAGLQLTDDSKLDGLIATYGKNRPNATPSDIYFAVTTDRYWRMDAITQAERKAAQHAAPVYMYCFAWQTPVLGGKLKAMHGAELAFVFDNVAKAPGWVGTGADLQPLADKLSGAWTAFARSGNPNLAGLPNWPAYDPGTRATMIFNNECKVVNDPGKDERLAMSSLPQA
jgi:para-nitrobenzyl esterase